MLSEYEKLTLVDTSGQPMPLTIEVNWNPKDEETNDCKILKLTMHDEEGRKKEYYMKKEIFHSFLFIMGTREERMKMIPQKIKEVRKYNTVLGIKAKEDIKKGEIINVEVDIDLPPIEQEIIGEVKRQLDRGLPIIGHDPSETHKLIKGKK